MRKNDPYKKQQRIRLDIAALRKRYGSRKGRWFAGRKGAMVTIIIEHGYGIITYHAHASKCLWRQDRRLTKEVIARIGSTEEYSTFTF